MEVTQLSEKAGLDRLNAHRRAPVTCDDTLSSPVFCFAAVKSSRFRPSCKGRCCGLLRFCTLAGTLTPCHTLRLSPAAFGLTRREKCFSAKPTAPATRQMLRFISKFLSVCLYQRRLTLLVIASGTARAASSEPWFGLVSKSHEELSGRHPLRVPAAKAAT